MKIASDKSEQSEWPAHHKSWGLDWKVIPPPSDGTRSCKAFFTNWARVNFLLAFILHMAGHIDHSNEVIREFKKELESQSTDDTKPLPEDFTTGSPLSPIDILRKQNQLFSELLLCKHIDNYLTFLSNLIQEIFSQRPEILKSKEQVDIQLILEQNSMEEVIKVIAERKVQQLTYASFFELSEYFSKRLGLRLFYPKDESIIIEAIETRNISVHNNCTINRRYIDRVRCEITLEGKKRNLALGNVEPLAIFLGRAVKRLDRVAYKKFNLDVGQLNVDPLAPD
jgi:hypothetical protein